MAGLYQPHQKQVEAHLNRKRQALLFWGRQVGKTLFSIHHSLLNAMQTQGTYFMIYRTYKQAHEVVWRELLANMPPELLKRSKTNENDLTIELPYLQGPFALPSIGWVAVKHDTNKPRSIIQLLGSDQADTHRGRTAHGMVFDEYAFQDPENLRSVYNPMLSTTNGLQVFMSTPNVYNHWYDMVEKAREDPDWFYSEATWRDNKLISPEFIEKERKAAEEAGELSKFLAEYELQFRTVEGPVYEDFDVNVHVIQPSEVPKEGDLFIGIDFGFDNPTAVIFILVDYDDNWYVIDEIYRKRTLISDLVPMIRQKVADRRLNLIVGDSNASEAIAQLQQFFPVVPVVKHKDSIPEGIRLITSRLKPRERLVGPPKPKFFVTSNCKNTIYEMDQYHYPEKKLARNANELPVKDRDHCPDAIRYLALHLKYGMIDADVQINSKVKFNSYGLL